ncbi:LysM peptidoglycan-binding domain-containing protein [Terrilactibacillus laevilacticus]|uniref:LysM peptidoglycan-binding domain-containing protein n=1 Tax=Terrilactibacillus laevilacticus TaxID=1380157 RepID=A0ABW5PTG5_9BACI|nr:LysM domain-containing protein [Terrilactibacillus laevilacticus]
MKIYVVQKGDTLAIIAKKQGTTIETLKKLNPSLNETDELIPGSKVKVPLGIKKGTKERIEVETRSEAQQGIQTQPTIETSPRTEQGQTNLTPPSPSPMPTQSTNYPMLESEQEQVPMYQWPNVPSPANPDMTSTNQTMPEQLSNINQMPQTNPFYTQQVNNEMLYSLAETSIPNKPNQSHQEPSYLGGWNDEANAAQLYPVGSEGNDKYYDNLENYPESINQGAPWNLPYPAPYPTTSPLQSGKEMKRGEHSGTQLNPSQPMESPISSNLMPTMPITNESPANPSNVSPAYQGPSSPNPGYPSSVSPAYQGLSSPNPGYPSSVSPVYQGPASPNLGYPSGVSPAYQGPSSPNPGYPSGVSPAYQGPASPNPGYPSSVSPAYQGPASPNPGYPSSVSPAYQPPKPPKGGKPGSVSPAYQGPASPNPGYPSDVSPAYQPPRPPKGGKSGSAGPTYQGPMSPYPSPDLYRGYTQLQQPCGCGDQGFNPILTPFPSYSNQQPYYGKADVHPVSRSNESKETPLIAGSYTHWDGQTKSPEERWYSYDNHSEHPLQPSLSQDSEDKSKKE